MINQTDELKNIIACVDGSAHTNVVLNASLWSACQLGVGITLLHAHDQTAEYHANDLSGNIGMGSNESLLETLSKEDLQKNTRIREQGNTILKSAKSYLLEQKPSACELTIQKSHRHDSLRNSINNLVEPVELLVLGQAGTDPKTKVGAHLESIVRHANFPVLIVTERFVIPKKILFAFDNTKSSIAGIKWLRDHPLLNETEIHLLYVTDDTAEHQTELQSAKNRLDDTGLTVVSQIKSGVAKEVLVNYQQENDIDMLVMGAYGHSKIHEFFKGSTTTHVLKHNLKSVLMIRID